MCKISDCVCKQIKSSDAQDEMDSAAATRYNQWQAVKSQIRIAVQRLASLEVLRYMLVQDSLLSRAFDIAAGTIAGLRSVVEWLDIHFVQMPICNLM